MINKSMLPLISLVASSCLLISCTTAPPTHPNNICSIFRQYPQWYWASKKVRHQWQVPISVQMAIIYQESSFRDNATPPREKLLWIIPWKHTTSAYGYSQALTGTWRTYEHATGHFGSRHNFSNAVDFIGWYANLAHLRAGVAKNNAYALYLVYHEGIHNYLKRNYRHNKALLAIAHKVEHYAHRYRLQLLRCEAKLAQKPWWHIW